MPDTVEKAAARLRDVQATAALRAESDAREIRAAVGELLEAAQAEARNAPAVGGHPQLSAREAGRLVYEAMGEASMCWESPEGAGEFDSVRASQVGGRLLESLGYDIPAEYRPEPATGTAAEVDPGATRLGPVTVSGGTPVSFVQDTAAPGVAAPDPVRRLRDDPVRRLRNAAHDAVLAEVSPMDIHGAVNEGTEKARRVRRDMEVVKRMRAPLLRWSGLSADAIGALSAELSTVAMELVRDGLLDG